MPNEAFKPVKGSTIAPTDVVMVQGGQWTVEARNGDVVTVSRANRSSNRAKFTVNNDVTYKVARD